MKTFYTLFATVVVVMVGTGFAAADTDPFPSCNASWNNRLLQTQPGDRVESWEDAGTVIDRAPCPTIVDHNDGWVSERYFISRENGRFYTDCRERSRPELGWECRRVWRAAQQASVETPDQHLVPVPGVRTDHFVHETELGYDRRDRHDSRGDRRRYDHRRDRGGNDSGAAALGFLLGVIGTMSHYADQAPAPPQLVLPAIPNGYVATTCVVNGQPIVCYVPADPVH